MLHSRDFVQIVFMGSRVGKPSDVSLLQLLQFHVGYIGNSWQLRYLPLVESNRQFGVIHSARLLAFSILRSGSDEQGILIQLIEKELYTACVRGDGNIGNLKFKMHISIVLAPYSASYLPIVHDVPRRVVPVPTAETHLPSLCVQFPF